MPTPRTAISWKRSRHRVRQQGPGDYRPGVAIGAILAVACIWAPAVASGFRMPASILASLLVAFAAYLLIRGFEVRRRHAAAAAEARTQADSEARLRRWAERSSEMMVEVDREAIHRAVSPGSLSLLGYAPHVLVGRPELDFIHPEDLPAHQAALAALRDGARDEVVTLQRYRREDGTYLWTESIVGAVRDPATGEPTGYLRRIRDVSERRAAEIALRDSEAFLRGVIDSSPDCIEVLSLEGDLAFMGRNGFCRLDSDQPGVLGRRFADHWPPSVRPAVRSALAASASGAVSRFAARTVSNDGRPIELDVLVTPIMGSSGKPEHLLAITRDVTRASEAETVLQHIQERYRLLAENSSDLVTLRAQGPEGRALYVSPSCRRMLGYEPEAMTSDRLSELIHPDDRDGVETLLANLSEAHGIMLNTHRLRRADDAYIWVEGAFQLAERDGETVVVAALRDVTERQNRAEDLRAAKDLAERAQLAAEQASQAKSDFLAVVSHEIRTPLNSIIGFTDLMLDSGELPVPIQRHAELIRSAGSALLTVVNDLLDFSKAEAGAVELESLAFQPEALAQHCAAIVRGYAGTKALEIDVETAGILPPTLMGDEARLRQILLNLLNNAVKFTVRGRVTLRIANLGLAPESATLRFEIVDTGIGIPEAKQHRLFERFSQVDTSVARRFGGSGLGLAICKKLVELMGGTIGVTSREGLGSTFWFTLTLPLPASPKGAAPDLSLSPTRRKGRILLVEDIDINQRLAVALLDTAGHSIDIVADGAEAVAALAERSYDLVLMDVQMPGMDGMTATRLIRASSGPERNVAIVAMTANVFPEQIEAFRLAGMDDHVGKPLNRTQLHAVVDRWIGREAGPAASGDTVAPTMAAFDFEAYDRLSAYMGRARLDDILGRFAASLPWRFSAGDGGPEALRRWAADAHVVLSVAGMTGFAELASACRALQAAEPGSSSHLASLEGARAARDAAVLKLADLRRSLAAAAE